MERVVVLGEGPAAETLQAALDDGPDHLERQAEPDLADATVAVAVGRVGADRFETVDLAARETGTPWLAVELGGIGGYPVVDASVAGFDPARECYACLAGRVGANADPETEPVAPPDGPTARLAGATAAVALGTLLADEERNPGGPDERAADPLGRVVEVPHAERRFLPLPGCDCADERDRTVRRGHTERDLDETIARAEGGLDDRVGIVSSLGEAESYPAPYYLATLCNTSNFSDATAPRQAAGVAVGWNEAFMKALGESFERYAAAIYRRDEFVRSTRLDLDVAVSPSSFVRPGDSDVDAETELDWLPAENLASGASTSVPASLVVHPPADRPIRPAITTGLGLGSSGVDALLSGLYETIERDATMLAWYSTYGPLALTVDDDDFQSLAARARAEGLDVTPLLLTQDVDVPVVAVVVRNEDDTFPRVALGSAAHLDPHRAARGALAEAVQNWMELRSMGADGAADATGAIGEYATGSMGDLSTDDGETSPLADWLDPEGPVTAASVGPDTVPRGEDALESLVERLRDVGLPSYGVRTTTRDLEEMGFESVRVLVPAAQPLFLGESFFGERATSVPEALGFEPRLERPHHPFP